MSPSNSGLSRLIKDYLPGGASRLAALLLPQILPVSSVVAPCHPGAALRNLVLVHPRQATALAVLVFTAMAAEARRAARNERAQRARGGIEPPGDVYRWMAVAYPASFLAMLAEGAVRGVPPSGALASGVTVFALAKALKWWAILTLGQSWTFRVIVVPHAPLVTGGPYRFLRHPNYVAVVGEFVGVGLATGALVTGPIATLAFGALMLKRIGVEQRALAASNRLCD